MNTPFSTRYLILFMKDTNHQQRSSNVQEQTTDLSYGRTSYNIGGDSVTKDYKVQENSILTKPRLGTRRYFWPNQQILFFTQCIVIVFVTFLCLYKSGFSDRKKATAGSTSDETHFSSPFLCEENTTYLTLLSTCMGYLVPAPKSTTEVHVVRKLQRGSKAGDSDIDDAVDQIDGTDRIQDAKAAKTSQQHNVWEFVCFAIEKTRATFSTQTFFVIVMVSIACSQLAFASDNLSCELKTAYFMVITYCLTFLLPPVYSAAQVNHMYEQ